jgi:hypothetical protein
MPISYSPLGLEEETGFLATVGRSERRARIHSGASSIEWSYRSFSVSLGTLTMDPLVLPLPSVDLY